MHFYDQEDKDNMWELVKALEDRVSELEDRIEKLEKFHWVPKKKE